MTKRITAATGWRWFTEACEAFRRQPLGLTGVVLFYILISGIFSGIPIVGTLFASVWMPFGAILVGFATRDILEGKIPTYSVLVETMRKPYLRLTLMWIGLFNAIYMEIVVIVFSLLSKDAVSKWVITNQTVDLTTVANNLPVTGMIVGIVMYIPLFMVTLFAPLLAADAGQKVVKTFFYSFFGIVRHPLACLVTLLAVGGLACGFGFIFNVIMITGKLTNLFSILTPFVVIVLTTLAQAVIWPMYRDIFGEKRLFKSLP